MEYKRLNHSDLVVSVLCLGTSLFGTSLPRDPAFAQLDVFASRGGNFLDTAHVYGDWEPGEKARSERIIGAWMKSRGCRGKIVLSTKGGHPLLGRMDVSRVNTEDLETDLQASLDALQTDVIDIYFLHRDDPRVPVADMIEWLEAQKINGRIRYYGCSNWSLKRIIDAQNYAISRGHTGFICNQIQDSLADSNRDVTDKLQLVVLDRDFDAYHCQTGMNLMAYMAAARGYFAKKDANIALPDDDKELYDLPQNQRMLEVMKEIKSFSVIGFTFQYILQRSYPSIPIASFDNTEQMVEAIGCCCTGIPAELVDLVSAHKRAKRQDDPHR